MPMYYPVRFKLNVRSQGLLKHVTAVHARGNKWGGFLLSVLKLVMGRRDECRRHRRRAQSATRIDSNFWSIEKEKKSLSVGISCG